MFSEILPEPSPQHCMGVIPGLHVPYPPGLEEVVAALAESERVSREL